MIRSPAAEAVASAHWDLHSDGVASAFVLVHSLALGPLTWGPVAERLTAAGYASVVPELYGVADADPPFWPYVVRTVAATMDHLEIDQPVVLVAHSNAGRFMPLLVENASRPVRGCLFVDAALPALTGPTPVATAERIDELRSKAVAGGLPPWTQWWDAQDTAPLFPDPQTRAAISAEQPRLPLAYYEQQLPTPAGWNDGVACGYLLFGPPYDEQAANAVERGWLVEREPGLHLHQIVDPGSVTARLIAMSERLAVG